MGKRAEAWWLPSVSLRAGLGVKDKSRQQEHCPFPVSPWGAWRRGGGVGCRGG